MDRRSLTRSLFESVRDRLRERADSLERFYAKWEGTNSGLEGWLRVEFVAAVDPKVTKIRTGGAGGRGLTGKKYPDLLLVVDDSQQIPVELKAASSSWSIDGAVGTTYAGHLLAYIFPEQSRLPDKRKLQLKILDPDYQCDPICEVHGPKGDRTFYFVMLDLPKAVLEDRPSGIP
jgi:hypothetical protein